MRVECFQPEVLIRLERKMTVGKAKLGQNFKRTFHIGQNVAKLKTNDFFNEISIIFIDFH